MAYIDKDNNNGWFLTAVANYARHTRWGATEPQNLPFLLIYFGFICLHHSPSPASLRPLFAFIIFLDFPKTWTPIKLRDLGSISKKIFYYYIPFLISRRHFQVSTTYTSPNLIPSLAIALLSLFSMIYFIFSFPLFIPQPFSPL